MKCISLFPGCHRPYIVHRLTDVFMLHLCTWYDSFSACCIFFRSHTHTHRAMKLQENREKSTADLTGEPETFRESESWLLCCRSQDSKKHHFIKCVVKPLLNRHSVIYSLMISYNMYSMSTSKLHAKLFLLIIILLSPSLYSKSFYHIRVLVLVSNIFLTTEMIDVN